MPNPNSETKRPRVAITWECYGPYHHARIAALRAAWPAAAIYPVQISDRNVTYAWTSPESGGLPKEEMVTLFPGRAAERIAFSELVRSFRRFLGHNDIDLVFLPSYWPSNSAALLLAAATRQVCAVMMNESHAGTESASGWKRQIKKGLLHLFHAGLVGGEPHLRHFADLGMARDRLFTGYDAVDNEYFLRRADEIRTQHEAYRSRYGLPDRYILSLGRMVAKKNLATLIRAYAECVKRFAGRTPVAGPATSGGQDEPPALVFVGSGEEGEGLRALAADLGLQVIDRTGMPDAPPPLNLNLSADSAQTPLNLNLPLQRTARTASAVPPGTVYFYGFRQIDENPLFYALADVFVLPSQFEEWGLVVNEAMASGVPVIVSQVAGCAEDLVRNGENGWLFEPSSAADLAAKLSEILSDSAKARQMGARSREMIASWGCDNFARQAIRAAEAALL